MKARRLLTALRELFRRPEGKAELLSSVDLPGLPVPEDAPPDWRVYRCLAGPYWRFALSYPRSWQVLVPGEGELVHLEPRDNQDVALTLSTLAEPVVGPQGLLDAIAGLAEARGIEADRDQIELDRWGPDGWASSWGWQEEAEGGGTRTWRLLLLGHEHGMVFVIANGSPDCLNLPESELESILSSVRLPPAILQPPERFPLAILEVLNDRRAGGEAPWFINESGQLQAGEFQVGLPNLYRIHLSHSLDLDEIASVIESHQQNPVQTEWAGREWAEISPYLRVVLRRQEAVSDLDIVTIPLPEGLVACPVLDSESRITFIPKQASEQWGVDSRSLMTQAIARMEAHSNIPMDELVDTTSGEVYGYRLAGDDGYDSGRLLCNSLRGRLEALLGGPLIVALPTAGQVLVLRDEENLRSAMAEQCRTTYGRKEGALSPQLWHWTEEGLTPVPPP